GNILSGNEQVNIMSTFVCDYRLKIHAVAHDAVLTGDTHTTQNLTRFASNFDSDFTTITFSHRNLSRSSAAFISQLTQAPYQKLTFGNFGNHFCQLLLLQLESTNWFTKLNTLFGITQRSIITIHSRTQCTPSDTKTGTRQAAQRTFKTLYARKNILFRYFHIIKNKLTGSRST